MSNVRNLMDQYRDELDKKYGVQESTPDFLDMYKDRFAQWETNRINRENQLRQQKVQSTISNVNDNSYETVKNNENNYGKNKENKLMSKTDNFIKGIGFADKILQTGDYIGNQMVASARERVKAKEELDKLKNTPIQKMNKDELNDYWKTLNNLGMQTNRGTPLDKLFVNATKDVDITKNSYATEAQKQITAQAREEMTKDMGAVGKFVTEGLWSGTDMALTAGASAVTGIPFLAMQGGMSGAQSGQEALSKGYDAQTAGALAIGSGTITAGVESFGGIAGKWGDKIFKNKAVQSLTNKLPQKAVDYISKISSTKAGQIFGDMASEGLEEIAEYDLQRIYQNLILDEDTPRDVKEQLYAGAQGAFVGGLFGGGKAILNKNNVQSNANDNTTVENKENISLQTNASEQSETNNIIQNQKEVILKAQQDTQLDNKAKVIESAFEKVSEANFQNETEMINAVEKLSNETGNKVSIIENERIPKTIISDGNKNIFLNMSNYRTIDNNNSETYNEEKGGNIYAVETDRGTDKNRTQSIEIFRGGIYKDGIFGRGLSENQGNSRISFETSGANTQRGRGERKTREINGDELSYNLTPEEEINENVYKAVKGLRDIGIETDVYSGDIYINGNPRQKNADATTVSDEFILVNNNAELSAEEMIAHEGFHYHYNKGNKQAIEYQRTLLKNIDIFDKNMINLFEIIRKNYPIDKVNTELAAYFSGWLNEDAEGTIQEYKSAFINSQAVLDAHKAFMADIQQNTIAANNGTSNDVSFNFAQNQDKYQKTDAESGKIRETAIAEGKKEVVTNIEDFASKKGLKVKYYQAPADSVGNGFIDKDTIYINVQDSNVMYKTAIHETLHGLRNNNKAEYQRLYQQIKTYAEGNSHLKDYAERVMLSYTDPLSPAYNSVVDEKGNVNQDILSEEVLAKLCEEVIQDPVSFIEKTKKNNNIITVIQDLLRKIKNNLAIKLTNSEKARLDNALLEIEKYMRGVSDNTTSLKYHISNTASDEIDRVLSGKNNTNEVKLRDYTPSILVEHGVKDLPMLMNARHLRENILTEQQAKEQGYTFNIGINYHGLGKELFMKVIDSLDNPERVYRGTKNADNSARKENYFLIITTVTDDIGNKINVPVHINQTALYNNLFVESNKIATVFGRKNINEYINREIKKGNLVLAKKKGGLPIKSLSPIDRHLDNTTYADSIQHKQENINSNNLLENGRNITDGKKSINIIEKSDKQKDFKGLSIEESIEKISQSGVTAKSADVQRKAENTLVKSISNAFGVSYADKQGVIKDMVKEISKQIKQTGKIDNTSIDNLMNIAFNKGKIIDDNFSKQYNSLKKELRETKFKYTPTEVFQDMRKKYFGKLAFSKDGIDVDILYKEFSENYPELFSSSIVNPEDQIVRIGEVYDKLAEKEISLDKYYGESSDEFKEYIKQDLQYAINKYVKELNQVEKFEKDNRRIILEKEQRKANYKPMTQEEYKSAQKKVYNAQKAYDKVIKDILLTEKEKKLVDTLINGGDPNLVTGDNRNEILAVYSAKKALEDAKKPIRQYKQEITQYRNDTADSILKTFRGWKDKKIGLAYSTETFERNIRDIVPDGKVSQSIIDTYISPIHKSEAESNRLKNSLREKIRALKLDTGNKKLYDITVYGDKEIYKMKVNESSLVQLLGEKKITEKQVEESGADLEKIKNAVTEFTRIYKDLYDMANDALLRNGYAPLGEIKNYFPHFMEENDTVLTKLARKVGFEVQNNTIPTSIAGMTETFKPGKTWFANALTREGKSTVYDAVKGFDQYIDGVANIIYHTDNIQNLRAFENRLRYLASDKGVREEFDRIETLDGTEEDKIKLREELTQEIKNFNLSNFVTYLRDYTNNLAGKKSPTDRGIEHDIGRGIYTLSKSMENRIAGNMIGANIGSALTNFIPIAQASGEIKTVNMLRAMNDTMKSMFGKDDGFVASSDFLTNRFPGDKLMLTKIQKASKKAGVVMEIIDSFTSNVVTRAKYLQNIDSGMDYNSAIENANSFAASILADRSKGAVPLIFDVKNPITKAITMFQVEQNNQLRYLVKDLPRNLQEKGMLSIIYAIAKYAIASWLYNFCYEKLIGRKPAFDPIDIGYEIYKDFTTEKPIKAISNTITNVSEELPFVSGLVGGGRIPISSAFPNGAQILKLFDNEVSSEKKKDILKKEGTKPLWYLGMPFAGGQAKKAFDAYDLIVNNEGVQYSVDDEGEKKVQFAFDTSNPIKNAKTAVLGKWSIPEAKEYVDNGFKGLSKEETVYFEMFKKSGMSNSEAFELAKQTRKQEQKTEPKEKGMSQAEKNVEKVDRLVNYGVDRKTAYETILNIKKKADYDGNGSLKQEELIQYLDSKNWTKEQKALLFEMMFPKAKNNPYK